LTIEEAMGFGRTGERRAKVTISARGSLGSAEDLMGAVMLRATFRAARVLVRMDSKEA
jgi:hypothetical protein